MTFIPDRGTDGYNTVHVAPFAAKGGWNFRGVGFKGTATAGTTTNIQYKLTEARRLNGAQLIVENHASDDSFKYQIVDVDGAYGAAGTVLACFGDSWNVCTDVQNQGHIIIPYPADLLVNLYIRVAYTSTGGTDVKVRCNLFLHKAS